MIRLFLLAAGFLSVTIALLVTQLGESDETEFGTMSSEATRAGTDILEMPTRSEREQSRQVPERSTAAAANLDPSSTSPIDMMTQTILQELRKPVTGDRLRQVAHTAGGQNDTMRTLTDGVLAGLGGTANAAPAPEAPPSQLAENSRSPDTLNTLIIHAMREGQSDAYVDSLINEAVGSGRVQAPDSIVTSSGDVDTATLLDSLVQHSAGSQTAPTAAPVPPTDIASVAPEKDLFYVVQPGDSLAGIALRHYGTTTAHDIIYTANRDILPTPSAVRPGMTLRIPAI